MSTYLIEKKKEKVSHANIAYHLNGFFAIIILLSTTKENKKKRRNDNCLFLWSIIREAQVGVKIDVLLTPSDEK
jgi:hypothetical protein